MDASVNRFVQSSMARNFNDGGIAEEGGRLVCSQRSVRWFLRQQ